MDSVVRLGVGVRRGVALVVSWVLVATLLVVLEAQPVGAAGAVVAAVSGEGVGGSGVEAPDVVSAGVNARLSGVRVEVVSLRSEFRRVWVNPDGSVSVEESQGVARFRDEAGLWREVDLGLEAAGSGVAVKAHPLGLKLAGRGGVDLVSVGEGRGRGVTLRLPKKAPKPVVVDGRGVYGGVWPGVDVVVSPRRSGFEQWFVINDRDAVLGLGDGGAWVSWELPVLTRGLAAKAGPAGSVEFVDSKGVVVSRLTAPEAWDAVVDDRSGLPANRSEVVLGVSQRGKGQAVVTVSVSRAWLLDEDRVFPVTVDPTYASASLTVSGDTYVGSNLSGSRWSDPELRVGTYDGGTSVNRSYINFNTSGLAGRQVMSAELSLYQSWAWSCTPSRMDVFNARGVVTSATVWSSKPAYVTSPVWSVTAAKRSDGGGDCAAGRVKIPVTGLVRGWASSGEATSTLMLKAGSDTDSNGWKRFSSADGAYPPVLTYTYNRAPAKPVEVGLDSLDSNTYVNPGSGEASLWTAKARPRFVGKAGDADGNTTKLVFEVHTSSTSPTDATLVASCATGLSTAGVLRSCAPGVDLPDRSTLFIRAKSVDGAGLESGWSGFKMFRRYAGEPTRPIVSCPAPYANGSWHDTAPASDVTCTVTAAGLFSFGRNAYVDVSVDDGPVKRVTVQASTDPDVAKFSVKLPKGPGAHSITTAGVSFALVKNAPRTYQVGWGKAGLTTPAASPRVTTTGGVKISATAPPPGAASVVDAVVQYRVAGGGDNPWHTAADVLSVTTTPTATKATGVFNTTSDDVATAIGVDGRTPVVLDVQVCFSFDGLTQCTSAGDPTSVFRVPHAFGSNFPVEDVGFGQVALFTGELAVSSTDASVPGYDSDLSVSRSHTSYGSAGTPATGVFGPGWQANIDGPEAGLAGLTVFDNTLLDGSLVVTDFVDIPLVFTAPSGKSRKTTGASSLETGSYTPASADTITSQITATVSKTPAGTVVTLGEPDGTKTVFTTVTAPGAGKAAVFAPDRVIDPLAGDTVKGGTRFIRDTTGRVTHVVSSAPGVECDVTALVPGCRVMKLTYAPATSQRGDGDYDVAGQVSSVASILYDQASKSMLTTVVAAYGYDASRRLVTVTDPRSGLATRYTYQVNGSEVLVKTLTPPGVDPFAVSYLSGTASRPTQVGAITRTGRQQARFIYGLGLSGAGLPDLNSTGSWEQASPPVAGTAVFDARTPLSATTAAGVDPSMWVWAAISYTNAQGAVVNTAAHGAGQWQLTSTDYDEHGNTTRTLDEGAMAAILAQPTDSRPDLAAKLGTESVYNTTAITNTSGVELAPAGTRLLHTWEPARPVADGNGTLIEAARPHTTYTYDQGAPNDGIDPLTGTGYALVTTKTLTLGGSTITDGDLTAQPDGLTTTYGYDAIAPGDKTGWEIGSATSTTIGGITTVTRYDEAGRVIEQRQPSEASTGDGPGTRITTYYTATPNPSAPQCGGKPHWAGLECQTGPKTTPATGLATTTTTYTPWLAPDVITETSNGATRVTTHHYDTATRLTSTSVTTTGLDNAGTAPQVVSVFDKATGLLATQHDADNPHVRQTFGYDSWGRQTTYTNQLGDITTTTYGPAGVASVTTPMVTTTYDYDGTDPAGHTEHRGLVTRMTHTPANGATPRVFTGAYDAQGDLITQSLPGGLTHTLTKDTAGQHTGSAYTQDTTGEPLLQWAQTRDMHGRVIAENTPAGSAFSNGNALAYEKTYRYDPTGNLSRVTDKTATGPGLLDDPGAPTSCTTRTYTFDVNSNRTKTTTETCGQSPDQTTTWAYNPADAALTGGNGQGTYTYDPFGRQTTIPAADTPAGPTAGDLTLGYYDNNLPATITQNQVTTHYTLDLNGNRLTQTTTGGKPIPYTGTTPTPQLVHHYTASGDNPSWVAQTDGTTTTTLAGLNGDATITHTTTGDRLLITNPHGDIVTTINPADPTPLISEWVTYTEYGTPTNPAAPTTHTGPAGYGWIGTKQRSTPAEAHGLTLMGARNYNPTTGRFTTTDPIHGGNDNTYTYPTDPINAYDLDGNRCIWTCIKRGISSGGRWAWRNKWEIGGTMASFIPATAAVSWGYRGYRAYRIYRGVNKTRSASAAWHVASRRNAKVVSGWLDKGTLDSSSHSFVYHYAKHKAKRYSSPGHYSKAARRSLPIYRGSSSRRVKRGILNSSRDKWVTFW